MSNVPHLTGSRTKSLLPRSASHFVRSALSTGGWLQRAIWVRPLIAAAVLATFAFLLRGVLEQELRDELSSRMSTLLDAEVESLRLWVRSREKSALSVAVDPTVVEQTKRLVAKAAANPNLTQLELLQAEELVELRRELEPLAEAEGYSGWMVVSPTGRVLASARNELVGVESTKEDMPYVERVLKGVSTVSPPRKSLVLLPDAKGELRQGRPSMFAWAPVRNEDDQVIAVLGLRLAPEDEFAQILAIARPGKTGETYVVTQDGRMVTSSRFEDSLRNIGLLTEDEESILNVLLRDPGVDLTKGKRPKLPRSQQPPNRVAASLAEGKSEIDVAGYRDYRGAWSVGAWTWLPGYEVGVVTEQSAAEAFEVLTILRMVFGALFVLLMLLAVGIFIFMAMLERKQREAQKTALQLKRLGQYTLEEKLGEGGMGVVYRGHHAMLHRPTAIKFLQVEKTNAETVARFEREVQLTGNLTHPNTIAIYDYGRTPEGIFYYAMEYLEGIDLENLVRQHGPLPEARVVFLLQQVCGSLTEAHGFGVIHRDIKPANIFLTSRGGMFDFVKLLDFGLVRAMDEKAAARLTSAGAMAGTPLYLSPEAIERPDTMDARSDLYAVGAVGYYLLTGTPVFDGQSIIEIVQKHVSHTPDTPSQRLGQVIHAPLEDLLLRCLHKSPDKRPQSAAEILEALSACALEARWTLKDAAAWWKKNTPGGRGVTTPSSAVMSALGETYVSRPE